MKRISVVLLSAVAVVAGLFAAEIKLPTETARLAESPLPGFALASTYCYTCHSVDYVRTQPVSSRAYWKSSVVKMQKTFGAPIPDAAVDALVDYLVKTYGNERDGSLPAAPASVAPVKK